MNFFYISFLKVACIGEFLERSKSWYTTQYPFLAPSTGQLFLLRPYQSLLDALDDNNGRPTNCSTKIVIHFTIHCDSLKAFVHKAEPFRAHKITFYTWEANIWMLKEERILKPENS